MTELIGVAAVAVVAWFAAGTIWNVRAGRELMRWMQGGLPLLGEPHHRALAGLDRGRDGDKRGAKPSSQR